jgi:hypothetical protein
MIAPPKPPSHDDTEALIEEARARQLRRRLLGAAGIAVAAAIALGLYALTAGGDSSRSTAPAPIGPAGVPLCRSSQLSRSIGDPIGPQPGPTLWVVLTNTSRTACSLPVGTPKAWVTWQGKLLPTHERHLLGIRPAEWYPLRPISILKPGTKAGVTLEWRNWCAKPRSNRDLMRFHLRFDKVAGVSFSFGPRPACHAKGSPSTVLVSRPLDARG